MRGVFFESQRRRVWWMSLLAVVSVSLALTGCFDPEGFKTDEGEEEDAAEAAAVVPEKVQKPAEPPAQKKPGENALMRLDAELVDMKKAMAENPNYVATENRINASDPLTAVSQGYFAAMSNVYVSQLKHAVDLYRAEHDQMPTFEEFQRMLEENNVELKGLYRWQVYAYDEETGDIVVLEDPVLKEQTRAEDLK